MKKRLALCYSGQPRYIKENIHNHWEHILEPNINDYEIDMFCHFWYKDNISGFYDHQQFKGKQDGDEKDFFLSLPYVKKYVFEEQKQFDVNDLRPDNRWPHPVFNTVSMYYSLEKSNDLKSEYEKENNFEYDCCVRIRSDLIFQKNIKFNEYDMNVLNIEQGNPNVKYSMSDFFAFGNSDIMNKFSKTYSKIYDYSKEGCSMSSDILLGYGLYEDQNRIVKIQFQQFGGFQLYNRF